MKKRVLDEVRISSYTTFDEVSIMVDEILKKFPEVTRDAIEFTTICEYGDDWSPALVYYRNETPEEEKVRLDKEKNRLEYRRQQYEQLKKEFGE
jgi:hypothetical protein